MKESEAQAEIDGFWLWFAPVWFRWLSIICMMAAIKWLGDKSGDWLLGNIYWLSVVMCGPYFSAIFCRRDSWLLAKLGRVRWTILLAYIMGSLAAGGALWLSLALVDRIARLSH